jgi:nucleotide-binding universal stress UspA family protein
VLGHTRHALLDRLFGTETALHVMRLAHVPVLAVPAESRELPRMAVAAVDFSEFSREAAQTAADLLGRPAELHLAHVSWRPLPDMPRIVGPEWVESYHESTRLQLKELAEALESAGEARVETHLLEGDPAREVLRLAEAVGAELIAAGSHGASFFSRLVMGSVSTQLVRRATCAVLIAPPRTPPAELERAWRQAREGTTASASAHAGSAG